MGKRVQIILCIAIFLLLPQVKALGIYESGLLKVEYSTASDETLRVYETFNVEEVVPEGKIIRKIKKPKTGKLEIKEISINYSNYDLNKKYEKEKGVKHYSLKETDEWYEITIDPMEDKKIRRVYIYYSINRGFERGRDLVFYEANIYNNNENTLKVKEVEVSFRSDEASKIWGVSGNLIKNDMGDEYNKKVNFALGESQSVQLILGVEGYDVERVPITSNEEVIPKFNKAYNSPIYEKVEEVKVEEEKKTFPIEIVKISLVIILILLLYKIGLVSKIRKILKLKNSNEIYFDRFKIINNQEENKKYKNLKPSIKHRISPIHVGILFNVGEELILNLALIDGIRNGRIYRNVSGEICIEKPNGNSPEEEFLRILYSKDFSSHKGMEYREIINIINSEERREFLIYCYEEFNKILSDNLNMNVSYNQEMKRRGILSSEWIKLRDMIYISRGKYESTTPAEELKIIYIYSIALQVEKRFLADINKKPLLSNESKAFFEEVNKII